MKFFTLFSKNHDNKSTEDKPLPETMNIEGANKIIKQELEKPLGIIANYSHDGQALNNLENILVPQATEKHQTTLINNLIKFNSPSTLKLILLDSSSIIYDIYNQIPHMLIPVVTNVNRWIGAFTWICAELRDRTSKFLEVGAKNINDYNKLVQSTGGQRLPRIVIIVNEMHDLPDNAENNILQSLLKSNCVGIYLILFSKFSVKNLSLGIKIDLLKVYNGDQLNQIFDLVKYTPDERINTSYDNMDGHEFEHFCASLLQKNRFQNVVVTQGSGDHGIDILAEKEGITYAIQCKCYQSNVGNSAVQEAHSGKGIYKKDIAVVMTNRYFTNQAIEDAGALGVKLWDRTQIEKLISNSK
ncbi:MAG: restriction endonuclease [Clostridium sp.]|nr:restriction endonuclease [Clostridium sp.]